MADLFKALKPKASPVHNGFDLSQKHVFSSKAGMAIPCLSVETVPGDKFEIDMSAFMRTETLNAAAFLRGKFHYDFFFVPYQQLWHNFNLFVTERDDKHSMQQRGFAYCPVVRLSSLLYFAYLSSDVNIGSQDHLGFYDIHQMPIGRNVVRLLDMLGYGCYDWIFECADLQSLQTALAGTSIADKFVNFFRIAAYQHIFYDWYRNKFYEVSDTGGIAGTVNGGYVSSSVSCFNFDDLDCSSFASSELGLDLNSQISIRRFAGLLTPRYVQWKKDIFTSSLPSQQFGVVSSVDVSGQLVFKDGGSTWAQDKAYVRQPAVLRYGISNPRNLQAVEPSTSTLTAFNGTWSIPSAFDVLQLRKAEVLQKYKQNMLRAGNMTDDNFEAHYGVKPYYAAEDNVHYLGSFSSKLDINPVEATAASSQSINGRVGDIAANGTSLVSQGDKIRFDCKDFGIIMCICNFVPESEYQSEMMDKANSLFERFDFFTPEFQDIGLEAISRNFLDMNISASNEANGPIGYAPRYWMYKSAIDKVHGEFVKSGIYIPTDTVPIEFNHDGSLRQWVAPRFEFINQVGRSLQSLYVSPFVYDNVFGVSASSHQDTDQFLHNVFFDVKAIRPMSVLGLPQF